MTEKTYPYCAWVLTPGLKPVEIELVGRGYAGTAFDRTVSGRNYAVDELYSSKASAVASGEARLAELAADIAKRQACWEKRRRELLKHK